MRNKKVFSFDEEKDAIDIINNGFTDECVDYSKMYLVAKYLRQKFGYGEIRLERELIKFCTTHDKNFNPITEAEAIKKWVKTAMEYRLRKVDAIYITDGEENFLHSIDSPKDRKILFVTLVLAKALKQKSTKVHNENAHPSESFYIHYSNLLDIIRLSKIKGLTELGVAGILSSYRSYFEFYNAEKELIKLKYAEDGFGYEVAEFNDLVEHYDILFAKKEKEILKNCVVCGKELFKSSNRQKTCPECSIILARERKARWRNKQRRKL